MWWSKPEKDEKKLCKKKPVLFQTKEETCFTKSG